jgi:hypothetical protein
MFDNMPRCRHCGGAQTVQVGDDLDCLHCGAPVAWLRSPLLEACRRGRARVNLATGATAIKEDLGQGGPAHA